MRSDPTRGSTLIPVLQGVLFVALLVGLLVACQPAEEPSAASAEAPTEEELRARAGALAQELLIVDTHVDVPYRLRGQSEAGEPVDDISERTEGGDFDYPRARQGGLDAPFMSIFVPASYQNGGAKELADDLIDMVEGFETNWPEKFAVARSPAEVEAHVAAGKIALPLGMENGAPIEGDLENLRHFYDRGIRYITLTHGENNHICDSSYAAEAEWNGLSPFGREVVAEMNRLGIMIDVSHISDAAFDQVMELSKAPVIASHSSCRAFTPGWQRNMSDDMIRRLAENGGVIQINFGSSFLEHEIREHDDQRRQAVQAFMEEHGIEDRRDPRVREMTDQYLAEHPRIFADVTDVVAHIDHVVELVGIDHVGLGSDFDGVGDSLPTGLKSVADLPNLIFELLKAGYSEEDVAKICSGNTMRVWRRVEEVAAELQAAPGGTA